MGLPVLEGQDPGVLTFPRLFVELVVLVPRVTRLLARSRVDLVLENLVLRQQVTALLRERPRPRPEDVDRGVLLAVCQAWSGWRDRLMIVKPETGVRWHRERFRRYWTRLSRRGPRYLRSASGPIASRAAILRTGSPLRGRRTSSRGRSMCTRSRLIQSSAQVEPEG